jgi:GcrA cell cycle regulator
MWTEQTIGELRRLALEGKSAAWIATAIGAPSRNAVIGKARRLGVKLNGTRSESAATDSPAPPPTRDAARKAATPRARTRAPVVRREKTPGRRGIFAESEAPDVRRVGLAEIGEAECRWPLGEPAQDDFAYCGIPVAKGQTYCACHCRLAYSSHKYLRITA